MDRKKIIEIIIIVVAFGGSGFVLYNGLYSKPASPPENVSAVGLPGALPGAAISQTATPNATAATALSVPGAALNAPAAPGGSASAGSGINGGSILPYGDKLDFSGVLSRQHLQFDAIEYPVLNASSEVGVLPQDLLK